MKCLVLIVSIFITNSVCSMQNIKENPITENQSTLQSSKRLSINPNDTKATEVYIPRSVDVSRQLKFESKCCFCTSRWIIQPLMVVSSLASVGLVGVGEYFISNNPTLAAVLNGLGLACGTASFVLSVLMIKVNNKLVSIDNYFDGSEKN